MLVCLRNAEHADKNIRRFPLVVLVAKARAALFHRAGKAQELCERHGAEHALKQGKKRRRANFLAGELVGDEALIAGTCGGKKASLQHGAGGPVAVFKGGGKTFFFAVVIVAERVADGFYVSVFQRVNKHRWSPWSYLQPFSCEKTGGQ